VQHQQAWRSIPRSSTDRSTDGSFEDVFAQSWFLASANGAQAVLDYSDADKISGQRSARIRIAPNAAGANVWDVFLYQTGATLEPHKVHVLRFWAKTTAPAGKTIQVSILRNGYPWESLGLTQQVRLTPSWQRTELRFIATDSVPALVAFAVGGSNGDVFLDSIFLAPPLTDGLHAEESLEQASVILLHPDSTPTPDPLRDAALFLTLLETRYTQVCTVSSAADLACGFSSVVGRTFLQQTTLLQSTHSILPLPLSATVEFPAALMVSGMHPLMHRSTQPGGARSIWQA
jgi:hypothetical protein